MKVLVASIEDVFREAAARWTLIAYFVLSTAFILLFAAAVNLDVVDGTLAGAKLFGQDVDIAGEQINLDKLVLGFESGISAFLYIVGIFLAIFATAHLVPRLQDKGTVDLYLSRPVSRTRLLLSRYVAGLLLAATNVVYLIVTIWIIIIAKTGVVHVRFLLAGVVILFVIATLLAFAFLVGVVTSSTAVSIMGTFGLFFMSAILAAHDRIEAALSSAINANIVHAAWAILPKTSEMGAAVVTVVAGESLGVSDRLQLTPSPFLSTAAFGLVCLSLACLLFRRKEF